MNHEARLFADDVSIRRIGEAFLALSLPKGEWTHEAHLATCAWLIIERPDISPERDLPDLIRSYNTSVGGVNSDSEGYHETITQVSIRGVRRALARSEDMALCERVNALLKDGEGRRDWPLNFYSRERLFSKDARLGWAEPDLTSFDSDQPLRRFTPSTE